MKTLQRTQSRLFQTYKVNNFDLKGASTLHPESGSSSHNKTNVKGEREKANSYRNKLLNNPNASHLNQKKTEVSRKAEPKQKNKIQTQTRSKANQHITLCKNSVLTGGTKTNGKSPAPQTNSHDGENAVHQNHALSDFADLVLNQLKKIAKTDQKLHSPAIEHKKTEFSMFNSGSSFIDHSDENIYFRSLFLPGGVIQNGVIDESELKQLRFWQWHK